jgi:hypothetical protein
MATEKLVTNMFWSPSDWRLKFFGQSIGNQKNLVVNPMVTKKFPSSIL